MSPKRKKAAEAKSTTTKKTPKKDQSILDEIQNLNITKSYTSLAYGVVTVVVLFILVVVGIRTFSNQESVDITDDSAVTQAQGDRYIVKSGQTLWDISEEVYGTGFEWERIALANRLQNPGEITEGSELVIPRISDDDSTATTTPPVTQATTPGVTAQATAAASQAVPTSTTTPTQVPTATATPKPTAQPSPTMQATPAPITGDKYTVKEGDTLWDIALRARADGYRWVDIYHANKEITNPDLIFVGQVIVIPKKN